MLPHYAERIARAVYAAERAALAAFTVGYEPTQAEYATAGVPAADWESLPAADRTSRIRLVETALRNRWSQRYLPMEGCYYPDFTAAVRSGVLIALGVHAPCA
jgi:hypothetical protein